MTTTRRIVTGHDANGKAIFDSDDTLTPANPLEADGSPPEGIIPGFTTIFRTEGSPAQSQGPWTDHHGKKIPLTNQSGVVCRIVDFPPVFSTPDSVNIMHRTQSIDYGVVIKGTIQLVLDDGIEKTINEGDVVVQRATIHEWKNISKENCRILFVLVPAQPVKVEATGETLQPTPTPHLVD